MRFYCLKILFFVITVLFFSCKKDEPPLKNNSSVTSGGNGFVYVLNEGNFMTSNGSVTRLNLNDGAFTTDYFSIQNSGMNLGDVPQSMTMHNGKFYIVINNSGKIAVVDRYSFQYLGQISGLASPRYFLPVSNNKAYVSDLYANSISVVDLITNTKVNSILLNGWSEEMCEVYGKVFITNKNGNKVYVINSVTDQIIDSIPVSFGAGSIREDKFGKIWVLCSGDQLIYPARLFRINPVTSTIDTSFVFSNITSSPFKMCLNGDKDEMYFLDNAGVFKMNVQGVLPSLPFILKGSKNFYTLGIDPQNGTVYVGDAIDFNQNGIIYRYSPSGVLIDNFTSGIIPGFIYFDK